MKSKFLFLAFAVMSAFAQTNPVENDTYCQPALIVQEGGDGAGTAFFVRDSLKWYLVTAKHLVLDAKSGKLLAGKYNLLTYSTDLAKDDRASMSLNAQIALDSGRVHFNIKDNVVAIEMGKVKGGKEFPLNSYVQLLSGSKSGIIRPANLHASEDFKSVHLGDAIFLFGYPTSLGLKPMPQFDYDKPLLRGGTIGGKYEERHSYVLDCPVYAGNCGAPVIKRMDGKMKLVGVVANSIPSFDKKSLDPNEGRRTEETIYQNNSGYGVVVPIDVVSELVKAKK